MTLKVMPDISPEELLFIRERISGSGYADSYQRAFLTEEEAEKFTEPQLKTKGRVVLRRRRIKKWMAYLQQATPEQLVEDLYVKEIAFSKGGEAMKAADAYLKSQFAGKDVADIYLRTLNQIQAKIVVPCTNGKACKITLTS